MERAAGQEGTSQEPLRGAMKVERSIEIKASPEKVYEVIMDPPAWPTG